MLKNGDGKKKMECLYLVGQSYQRQLNHAQSLSNVAVRLIVKSDVGANVRE